MSLLNDLANLFHHHNQQQAPAAPKRQYSPIPVHAGNDPSNYQAVPGGHMLYGATSSPGQRVSEDMFTFPNGGSYQSNPNGTASVNGGFLPNGSGLAEDSFNFGQPLNMDSRGVQGASQQPQITANLHAQQGAYGVGRDFAQGSGRQVQPSWDDPNELYTRNLRAY